MTRDTLRARVSAVLDGVTGDGRARHQTLFGRRLSLWALSMLVVAVFFGMSQMEYLWVEMEQRHLVEAYEQTRLARLPLRREGHR